MKILISLVAVLALAGCSMTPTQKKWTGVVAGVLIVGAIAAHDADSGAPPDGTTAAIGNPGGLPCFPQPDGTCR